MSTSLVTLRDLFVPAAQWTRFCVPSEVATTEEFLKSLSEICGGQEPSYNVQARRPEV